MGGLKGLVPVRAEATPLLRWQLLRHRAAGGRDAIVVLGHEAETYRQAFPELFGVEQWPLIATSEQPELGQFASLHAGLVVAARAWTRERAVFVLPVDVPAAQASTWAALGRGLIASGGVYDAAIPLFGGRGGHPVLLSMTFAQELLKIDPRADDARLDVQLKKLAPERIVRVEVTDPLVVENLNTPEDVARFNAVLNV